MFDTKHIKQNNIENINYMKTRTFAQEAILKKIVEKIELNNHFLDYSESEHSDYSDEAYSDYSDEPDGCNYGDSNANWL